MSDTRTRTRRAAVGWMDGGLARGCGRIEARRGGHDGLNEGYRASHIVRKAQDAVTTWRRSMARTYGDLTATATTETTATTATIPDEMITLRRQHDPIGYFLLPIQHFLAARCVEYIPALQEVIGHLLYLLPLFSFFYQLLALLEHTDCYIDRRALFSCSYLVYIFSCLLLLRV